MFAPSRAPVRRFFAGFTIRSYLGTRHGLPTFERAGVGWLPGIPIQITAGVDAGYDDNVTLTAERRRLIIHQGKRCPYLCSPRGTDTIFCLGVGRFTQYFDVSGTDETDGNVTLSLTHNFSSRLSFYASVYGTYQNRAQFPIQCWPGERGSPFIRHNRYFCAYLSLVFRDFPMVTSYTFERVKYFSSSIGISERCSDTLAQNRIQNTFGESFNLA